MKIRTKRAYDPPSSNDGLRILVDRIWPRGVTKEKLQCSLWLKDIAPSSELRKWFAHDPKKWTEFKARYFAELQNKPEVIATLIAGDHDTVTLVYGAKEVRFNNAIALKLYLDDYLDSSG